MQFRRLGLLTVTSAALLWAAPAWSQDPTLPPTYQTISLAAGFVPDPQLFPVSAGGTLYAGDVDFSCYGYVADAPDYSLNFTAGTAGLGIYTISDTDTTLMINAPDGQWYCSDDNFNLENLNAGLYFEAPMSGQYHIWTGTYSESDAFSDATLVITETPEEQWLEALTATPFYRDTFVVRVMNNGNAVQSGLVTMVTETQVLANAALIQQGDQWIVEDPESGAALVARLDAVDAAAGLALLTVNGLDGSPALFALDLPEPGRNIALALPASERAGVLVGSLSLNGRNRLRHTALALDGEYGAAILNNCNEIIGLSQHSSPVLSSRLRPDEDFAIGAELPGILAFLGANNVPFDTAFESCLSEAELLSLAQEKIEEQEAELLEMEATQLQLETERQRLEDLADILLTEQEALEAENQARLDELAAREAELATNLEALEQAQAEQGALQEQQEALEEQARQQEEALAEAEAQRLADERMRVYQWAGFGVVVIALFGFVAVQVKRRKRTQTEAEESVQAARQQARQVEQELEKASAQYADIVLLGTDAQGAESRLKINGNSLIRSETGQVIGRSAQHADYVLNLETVSRRHLRLCIRDGKLYAEDLGSANGSAINNQPMTPGREYAVNSGDSLKIGVLTYSVNLLEKTA